MSEQANMAAHYEHDIPEGYEARIEGNKVIIELKESEDEKIIQKITAVLAHTPTEIFVREGIKFCECNDWLEKLKEQKPIEWSKDFEENIRILLHDKLTWRSKDGSISSLVVIDDKTLKDIVTGIWFYVGKEANKYPNKELKVEQKPTEWSEADDATHTRVLGALGKVFMGVLPTKPSQEDIVWFKSLPKRFNIQSKQECSEEDEKIFNSLCTVLHGGLSSIPTEKFISWLKSHLSQPQKEWSEEDEKKIKWFINLINSQSSLSEEWKNECRNWLKSFRPQPHWKPSKEQIVALGCVRYVDRNCATELETLYNDLKKLM